MKIVCNTKREAVEAMEQIEAEGIRLSHYRRLPVLYVQPEGVSHVPGEPGYSYYKGTGRYIITDKPYDAPIVVRRVMGEPYKRPVGLHLGGY